MTIKKTTAINLTAEEFVHPGNRACSGCGLSLLYRIGLKALGRDTITVIPPSCLTVTQGLFPIASTQVPSLNVVFASTAAAAAGVRAALKVQNKEHINVVAWAGDGGTSDIGIQALSAAIERGDDFLYICYDNEAYMNTGIQRSGTTPMGTITTTTPVLGKQQRSKDIPAIVAAHNPSYVASCSASYPLDFHDKIKKAIGIKGLKYIHIHCPCPSGWGMEERLSIKVGKLAISTGLYELYEIEDGKKTFSGPSAKLLKQKKLTPVSDYLKTQSRFRSISGDLIDQMQEEIDARWENYRAVMQ
ncbi:pyruvate synthase subunit beta [bacterium]|nr:pyruvate synthase subunit beta [bacterium]